MIFIFSLTRPLRCDNEKGSYRSLHFFYISHDKEERQDRAAHKRQYDKKLCDEENEKKAVHLNVGQIVKDRIPPEEIKVIEVPLKQSHLSLNLSDTAFETMGDQAGDSIDTSAAKIATGESAAKILKNSQRGKQKDRKRKEKT